LEYKKYKSLKKELKELKPFISAFTKDAKKKINILLR